MIVAGSVVGGVGIAGIIAGFIYKATVAAPILSSASGAIDQTQVQAQIIGKSIETSGLNSIIWNNLFI